MDRRDGAPVNAHWMLDQSDGTLEVHTGVTGRGAKLGHRLTILMSRWNASVDFTSDAPTRVHLTIDVAGLQIVKGEGGVKPLSNPEKVIARSNALGSLDADDHPQIAFDADEVAATGDGYRLSGTLTIHGETAPTTVELHVEDTPDGWVLSCETPVRQTEFGIKPYSLMMGSLKVEDEVTVTFSASHRKD